jgi:dihydroflavonol-4-reductase
MPPTLITGATGFVGSAVARAAASAGHELRLLVRPGGDRRNLAGLAAELLEGDLTDSASLARSVAGCRYLFHVAADYRLWVPDPDTMMAANVAGTRALFLAAQAAGVERIVYCSSVAALGLTGTDAPADETTPVHADKIVGVYKQSKYQAEQAVLALVREAALPAVIVNPSTPVGPRDVKPTPTGKMIRDAAAGRMPAYVDTGLNIVHVDDVAGGHLLALEKGRVGERYILGGEDFSLGDLFAEIAAVAGLRPPSVRLPIGPLMPVALVCEFLARFGVEPVVTRETLAMARKKMFFSSAKARAELGYAPRPARQAIEDAVAWFRANS